MPISVTVYISVHTFKAGFWFLLLRFKHECPEDSSVVPGGFLTDINPNSLNITTALVDESVKGAQVLHKFQFVRLGYFCVDTDSSPDKLVFNLTVRLKQIKQID